MGSDLASVSDQRDERLGVVIAGRLGDPRAEVGDDLLLLGPGLGVLEFGLQLVPGLGLLGELLARLVERVVRALEVPRFDPVPDLARQPLGLLLGGPELRLVPQLPDPLVLLDGRLRAAVLGEALEDLESLVGARGLVVVGQVPHAAGVALLGVSEERGLHELHAALELVRARVAGVLDHAGEPSPVIAVAAVLAHALGDDHLVVGYRGERVHPGADHVGTEVRAAAHPAAERAALDAVGLHDHGRDLADPLVVLGVLGLSDRLLLLDLVSRRLERGLQNGDRGLDHQLLNGSGLGLVEVLVRDLDRLLVDALLDVPAVGLERGEGGLGPLHEAGGRVDQVIGHLPLVLAAALDGAVDAVDQGADATGDEVGHENLLGMRCHRTPWRTLSDRKS